VVRVSGYKSRGPSSISGATRFSDKLVDLGRGPLSLLSTIEELLRIKSSGSGLEIREYVHRIRPLTMWHTLSANFGTNFVDKRRPFGGYSLFADLGNFGEVS
jgi:hypothetical protein